MHTSEFIVGIDPYQIFDLYPDMISICDNQQNLIYSNQAFQRYFRISGTENDGSVSISWIELLSSAPLQEVIHKLYSTGIGFTGDVCLPDSNAWFSMTVKPYKDGRGQISAALYFLREISNPMEISNEPEHYKQVQRNLCHSVSHPRESNPSEVIDLRSVPENRIPDNIKATHRAGLVRENYDTFFNSIDDFLFVLDTNGNIIEANSTVNDRLGYTLDELMGRSVLMVHPAERRTEADRIVAGMLEGTLKSCPVPLQTKSGMLIPVETRVTRGFWDHKPALFGVSKDVSQIHLSEEKFSKLFYLNPSACGLSDLGNHCYIEVNEAFCRLFGYEKEEVVGRTAMELGILSRDSRQHIIDKIDPEGRVYNEGAILKAKNGDLKHVLLSAENIYVQDKRYRFTVVNDITEHKMAEKEIKLKNEQLLLANSEMDRFFSIIAHDLKSPFNVFLGFTNILADDIDTLEQEDLQRIASVMRSSAQNLYRLLENLLEWSTMKRGMKAFTRVQLNLNEIFKNTLETIQEAAKIKGIDIHCEISDDVLVMGDAHMLNCVFRNLVTNAVKFTKKHGKIRITTNPVGDDMIEISVCDNGIGMSREMVENLFRIDVISRRPGTEGEPSTGLGLILCKEYIEMHGGNIRVESAEGTGTTFTFTIPANR